ncbi:MAG: carboxypeptidase regulatory-like domain-containing protein [Fibrobacter sp.]|nr:carboxypeptidase regulatory-like domain-containing protein [Fibrobacter sp.]
MIKTRGLVGALLFAGYSLLSAQTSDTLSGTVKDSDGNAVSGAVVSLKVKTTVKDTTDAQGTFSMVVSTTRSNVPYSLSKGDKLQVGIQGRQLQFSMTSGCQNATIALFRTNGSLISSVNMGHLNAGVYKHTIPELSAGFYVMQMVIDNQKIRLNLVSNGKGYILKDEQSIAESSVVTTAAAAASVDTIVTSKSGFATINTPIDAYNKKGVAIVLTKETVADCKLSVLPETSGLKENKKLPNPFAFYDGRKITKKSEWPCLRKEFLAMASKYFYGPMPPFEAPDVKVEGTVSASGITAKITYNGKTETMNFSTSGSGDILLISMGSGLAPGSSYKYRTLSVNTSTPNSWGGVCTKLFGKAPCGELAIAWGCNIVCRAIASDPDGGIDTNKIMTTGCSNTAKAAFISAAYCEGIKLAVVVESGGWGDASPRVAQYLKRDAKIWQCGDDPQGLWKLDTDASQFLAAPYMDQKTASWVIGNNSGNVYKLPFDTHILMACIAPRYFCGLTNGNGPNSWCHLNGTGSAVAAYAAEPVFNALGVPDHFGFDISKTYMHCMEAQKNYGAVAEEFFKRVFKGDKTAKTDVLNIPKGNVQLDPAKWKETWIDWDMNVTLE